MNNMNKLIKSRCDRNERKPITILKHNFNITDNHV